MGLNGTPERVPYAWRRGQKAALSRDELEAALWRIFPRVSVVQIEHALIAADAYAAHPPCHHAAWEAAGRTIAAVASSGQATPGLRPRLIHYRPSRYQRRTACGRSPLGQQSSKDPAEVTCTLCKHTTDYEMAS